MAAGTETMSPQTKLTTPSVSIRLARIAPGRMGMDSSRSLSLASYSWALAVNTLPMTIRVSDMSPYIEKYSQLRPAAAKGAAS